MVTVKAIATVSSFRIHCNKAKQNSAAAVVESSGSHSSNCATIQQRSSWLSYILYRVYLCKRSQTAIKKAQTEQHKITRLVP